MYRELDQLLQIFKEILAKYKSKSARHLIPQAKHYVRGQQLVAREKILHGMGMIVTMLI